MKRAFAGAVVLVMAQEPACNVLMYPFARAFGGPSEAELRQCRPAFDRMKARLPSAKVVIYPALRPKAPSGEALPGTAERLAEGMRRLGWARAAPMPTLPEMVVAPLGGNQLRYTWQRARIYAEWVRAHHPEGDYFVFSEILRTNDGAIHGLMLYVVEGTGQIAFVSLWNSHHFEKGVGPPDPEVACDLMLERFQRALLWDSTRMFPPYGVG